MGQVYDEITPKIADFLLAQKVFFVATAPSGSDGHVNVSPKGLDGSFVILGPTRVAYLDYGGTGVETIAHIRDNGRIVLMVCAFEGPPKIIRLHGKGHEVRPADSGFDELLKAFPAEPNPGLRSIIVIDVTRISDSCGFGVPLYKYEGQRDLLVSFWGKRSPEDAEAWLEHINETSIDGMVIYASD